MRLFFGKRAALTLVLLLVFSIPSFHCLNDSDTDYFHGGQAYLTVISGNDQSGQGGSSLPEAVVVAVTNSEQVPISNVGLHFEVIEGQGTIEPGPDVTTNDAGRASVEWIIDSSYNAIEVTISDASYEAEPCYVYAVGENPVGLSITRSINSFEHKADALYEMTFYGDYTEFLETINQRFTGSFSTFDELSRRKPYYCSLFSTFGVTNNYLFGRNFDNPAGWRCLTLITRCKPPDGYASIAPMRMRDIGFETGIDFNDLTFNEKLPLLEAAFFPPDGINEYGLVVGLANCPPQSYNPDPDKQSLFITYFVRKMLDYAKNVEEAVTIAQQYNFISGPGSTFDVHILVADLSGQAVILEVAAGELRCIYNIEPWHVLTNIKIYNVPLDTLRTRCWRYRTIYDWLESASGIVTAAESLDILSEVGNTYTQWSAIYHMSEKKITLSVDFDFDTLHEFQFHDF
ncbi:carcinine hydrolase/isopenicillin-N N-acyltransferase family protein [candidate division CSSED10-310 bacterium]|uniref:Carcinine hydrolase/isopenicillin-N N-acyltransferase family protein n=1 Tax=candidate division CSSED10-310 bacterium TaxID=2855610 RepID=A0ABV6Z0Z8_UNCC1